MIVPMERFDWLEAGTLWKVVWRCVTVEYGEQCVVICGEQKMQQWCVGNLEVLQVGELVQQLILAVTHGRVGAKNCREE